MIAQGIRTTGISGSGLANWVAGHLESFVRAWRWQVSFRRTLEELNRLSDRDLADLGIVRADLVRVAREAADRAV
ncbi:MAG: DUF1127 domain-containing protein [Paracoccaceae bacterium]|nr:DUF1127 domain-containing protein [Paracoccaceae bacterium]MDE2911445.1 DUF1127 domain-containing protein [Paracoccaceae bacterium]